MRFWPQISKAALGYFKILDFHYGSRPSLGNPIQGTALELYGGLCIGVATGWESCFRGPSLDGEELP